MLKKIIIVDDDLEDIEIIKESFQALGDCDCETFVDACDALAYLKNCLVIPHLIVIDINMPKMDGLQCLMEIRLIQKLHATTVAMYSSAIPMKRSLEDLAKSQAVFFQKPSSYAEMNKIFRDLV